MYKILKKLFYFYKFYDMIWMNLNWFSEFL